VGNHRFGGLATRLSRFTLEFSFAIGIKKLVLRLLFRRVVINRRFNLTETVKSRIMRNDMKLAIKENLPFAVGFLVEKCGPQFLQ
jgi:hypothetical protein